jgi:CubicO group peptidase (beta-lactamase class C family)
MADQTLDEALPKIRRSIARAINEHQVPGIAVGVVHDQELAWSQGFGLADIASKRPMAPDALFGVASVTKTFTAAAIVQLRDAGKLALDDPLIKFIPEFASASCRQGKIEDVTLRRLTTHTSGLIGEAPGGHWQSSNFPTVAQILEVASGFALVIDPQSAFKYSNLGYALLGEVISRVSGRPFTSYVGDEILAPLGMSSTCFTLDQTAGRMATGYLPHRYEDLPDVACTVTDHHGYAAAAGLRSSVSDLAKWVSLQFRTEAEKREGAQVLTGRSISEMHRAQFMEPDWKTGYCIAWWAARFGEDIIHNHGGSNPGYLSMVAFDKATRYGAIVLTNCQGHPAMGSIAFEALLALAGKAQELSVVSVPSEIAPTPEQFKRLLGRYELPNFGALAQIEFRKGALMMVIPASPGFPPPPPPTKLIPGERPGVFIVEAGRSAGEPLTFKFAPDGGVTGFILGIDDYEFLKL